MHITIQSFVSGIDLECIDLFIENDLTIQCAYAIEEEMSPHLVKICFKDSVTFVFRSSIVLSFCGYFTSSHYIH